MKERFFVGVGASAGGLEALSEFFSNMPNNTGATFIVVQHLSPDFKSLMDELLSRYTQMKIFVAEDGMETKRNSIYLIPPRTDLSIKDGVLYLEEYKSKKTLHLPIDEFFKSLAVDQAEKAIAVVLSGTGSDGSRGIIRVNENGGLVLAQSVETAKFDGMPHNAINTGICDHILAPGQMADEIIHYINLPLVLPSIEKIEESKEIQQLKRIGIIMNVFSKIDFNMYKTTTILRRVQRRIKVNKFSSLDDYISFLQKSDKEKEILMNDFLIGVTGFFRDNGAYDKLVNDGFKHLDLTKDELRVWVAGCSTGEEAYSIAIRLHEYIESKNAPCKIKIFSTDINQNAIDVANVGSYSNNIMETLPNEVVSKYFDLTSNGYRIKEFIRKSIVFAKHNLLVDPPFSKLDLLVCRNVLIYIKVDSQEQVIRNFYRSLAADGILFLGSSESLGELSNVFHVVDKKWNIYRKDSKYERRMLQNAKYNINYRYREPDMNLTQAYNYQRGGTEALLNAVVSTMINKGVLISKDEKIIQVINDCSEFIQPQPGKFSNSIASNIKKEYLLFINNILRRLKNDQGKVFYNNILTENGMELSMNGRCVQTRDEEFYLIEFDLSETKDVSEEIQQFDYSEEKNERIDYLEKELTYAKENLQATVEELETSNEELQSSNEELIASNEELQSTNEELQSVNEELYSVNNEYQSKIDALVTLNNDLNNLLNNTEVAAIYLDGDLRIRKTTPLITEITNIKEDDIERPFGHISVMKSYPDIHDDVMSVIDTLNGIEKHVKDEKGRSWLCKIKPYRKEQGLIEGIIITFVDITDYLNEITKTRQAKSILDYVISKGELSWFTYNLKSEILSFSKNVFISLGYNESVLPSTLKQFLDFAKESDVPKIKGEFDNLLMHKSKRFELDFEMKDAKGKFVIVNMTGEMNKSTIIGSMLVIK